MLISLDADIAADLALVRRLLTAQHPDLSGLPLRLVASGWDNDVYRLGDDLCVRVPRREIAAALLLNEQRWLPVLAPALPIPVPAPVRIGVPSAAFPWPWSVNPWLPGTVALDVPVAARTAFAGALGSFLNALHVPAPPDAPRNPYRGVPLASRSAAMGERFASGRVPLRLVELWESLVARPPWPGPPLWIQGDVHPGNLVVDRANDGRARLAAVIDFGDLACGDPASDLAAGWLVFDAAGRETFRAALGERIDEATWQRGRGWALNIGAALAADATGTAAMAAVAEHALDQVWLG